MHILIAFLTAVASLLYALERFGIDIGWINPWAWKRKRLWLKSYHANPAFSLESPLEAIALLLCATAKIDGDMTSDEKNELNHIFKNELQQTSTQANELLRASIFLMGSGEEIFNRPQDILAPNIEHFTEEQKQSSLRLLQEISNIGGAPSESQTNYIHQIESLMLPNKPSGTWH